MAVESMEMAPRAAELVFDDGGREETFHGWRPIDLGFSRREATYRRKGEVGGRPRGPHHA